MIPQVASAYSVDLKKSNHNKHDLKNAHIFQAASAYSLDLKMPIYFFFKTTESVAIATACRGTLRRLTVDIATSLRRYSDVLPSQVLGFVIFILEISVAIETSSRRYRDDLPMEIYTQQNRTSSL